MQNLPLRMRLRAAGTGLGQVLKRPRYAVLAALSGIIFYETIFWFNNWPLLRYVLTVPTLSPLEKVQFTANTYTSLWQSTSSPLAFSLVTLSIIQGIIISCLVFTIRRQRASSKTLGVVGVSGLASVLATLGLGCAACGTSLITPILLWLFSSSSVALADSVGFDVTLIGLAASAYALYRISLRAGSAALIEPDPEN